ncbi:helix-turn-helix transcriptional regulator [Alicyclobacillus cycloheptanicus]|uniref:CBS domain-containing protein/biotin operon repressor n=1 Tax=Alicyclobacillus cycloheptanicus TaxID=1457 RepID=A0ABT9XJH1_9BACL|nr:helix-turn-helix transcriptional regulator [Alicyclobacillus cycloheptanicus]MDQ0190469.1 CBS domain-containing protein/biotin operon repressor [Alicyclobacillus cycloheptanicus]WDM00768.1 helix-turn-helix transcriptional regulator [Alicyclobacillus cycloheptanicus]
MKKIELSKRQETILEIVKRKGPITGEQIAEQLSLTRATLRPDLAILTMAGFLDARPRVGYFYSGKKNADLFGESLRKLRVRDYKSVPTVIEETSSAYDAVVTLFTEDVGTLIVVRSGQLVGVVSRKDLLKVAIGGNDIHKVPVSLVMTRTPNVVTVDVDASLYDAAVLMMRHEVDSLPVVRDSGNEVVGRVSKTTITRAFVELGQYRDV